MATMNPRSAASRLESLPKDRVQIQTRDEGKNTAARKRIPFPPRFPCKARALGDAEAGSREFSRLRRDKVSHAQRSGQVLSAFWEPLYPRGAMPHDGFIQLLHWDALVLAHGLRAPVEAAADAPHEREVEGPLRPGLADRTSARLAVARRRSSAPGCPERPTCRPSPHPELSARDRRQPPAGEDALGPSRQNFSQEGKASSPTPETARSDLLQIQSLSGLVASA